MEAVCLKGENIMKRISNEDGNNAGSRNLGRLALALIPWALGIGFAAWLATWISFHNFQHQQTQEDRAAAYVGATIRPKGKIAIDMQHHDCTTVVRSDIDGSKLLLYARNDCGQAINYLAWHWQVLSPDGTLLKQGYTNQCALPGPGETAECLLEYLGKEAYSETVDDRADRIRVWTSITTD